MRLPEKVSARTVEPQSGVRADGFDIQSFFAEAQEHEPLDEPKEEMLDESDPNKNDILRNSLIDLTAEPEPKLSSISDLRKQLVANSVETVERFEKRVNVQTLDRGLSVVGNLVSVFGQLAASCGPLCLHALSGAGSAVSSAASASSGLGGLASAAGGLKFDGNGNVSFSGSVGELAQKTGYSADAIRSGAVSVSDLIAALSLSFGQGMGAVFGFGLIDVFANVIPDGKAA